MKNRPFIILLICQSSKHAFHGFSPHLWKMNKRFPRVYTIWGTNMPHYLLFLCQLSWYKSTNKTAFYNFLKYNSHKYSGIFLPTNVNDGSKLKLVSC